ncbi:MoaD/ThiS family protein [Thermodesulfobacteriota bacterium]
MIIEVKIHPYFHYNMPNTKKQLDGDKWDVMEGATVGQVLEMLKIPEKDATILLINGRVAQKDYRLKAADVFAVFPVLSGG